MEWARREGRTMKAIPAARKRNAAPRRRRVAPKVGAKSQAQGPVRWIVGIGASAGGLEAFSQLLEALATDTGMAFVLVQHLAPSHKSLLPDLLGAKTTLPVVQAEDGMALRANHVFVIPPNAELTIANGKLHLAARPGGPAQHLPINAFFHSLAQWSDGHSIGIILSGTADDGAIGLREIKAVGGITIAQDPATARHEGMPRAAIATDVVDLVLAPAAIAAELGRIAALPLVGIDVGIDGKAARRHPDEEPPDDGALQSIFQLLRKHSGVDFSQYKSSTVLRRLNRRMVLNRTTTVPRYLRLLRERPSEVGDLFSDLLIHVTSFFRDPHAFTALRNEVLPRLLQQRTPDAPLRLWVPGCSTGEEVYSLAICLVEAMESAHLSVPVQIFGTDVSDTAIQQARTATYSDALAGDIGPERLRRHFTRADGSFRANKALRDCCIFARHDVTRDPPFSRIDLVLCRNLLIYLGAPLQRRLVWLLHYALRPGGFLMLGAAESVGTQLDLFAPFDKANRIFVRKQADAVAAGRELLQPHGHAHGSARDERVAPPPARARAATHPSQEATQLLLSHYAPAGVIVDGDLRVVHFRGQTGAYLEPAPGEATLHLLRMLRGGLLSGTRSALQEARKSGAPARRESLQVEGSGRPRRIDVVVLPLPPNGPERHYLVLFEEGHRKSEAPARPGAARTAAGAKRGGESARAHDSELVEQLRRELAASRDYLQSVNQDLEAANEELQSANEEILSNNEELQSTNEELDTAKEEMQSTNEELNTLNDELRGRNDELSRLNGDLTNLLASIQVAIVIVGSDRRIRRFTPMAEGILHLIPSDVGRPFADLKPDIDLPDLGALIDAVIATTKIVEREVRDPQGRAWSLRIRPYQGNDGKVEGAVLSVFDVDAMVRGKQEVREALDLAEAVFATVREPMVVLDADLRVERANPAFCRAFGIEATSAVGALAGARWMRPELRRRLEEVFASDRPIEELAIEIDGTPNATGLVVNARRIPRAGGKPRLLLLAASEEPRLEPGALGSGA